MTWSVEVELSVLYNGLRQDRWLYGRLVTIRLRWWQSVVTWSVEGELSQFCIMASSGPMAIRASGHTPLAVVAVGRDMVCRGISGFV